MDWVDRLEARRRRDGLLHDQRPTSDEIDDFERRFEVVLPLDLREYFLRLNGTGQGMTDDDLISFWRLDELEILTKYGVTDLKDAAEWFVFADYSIWAHAYAIRLRSDRDAPAPVAICFPEAFQVASSMADFVSGYLCRDLSVLFTQPPDSPVNDD